MKKYLFGLGAMLVGAGLMFVLMHGEVSADSKPEVPEPFVCSELTITSPGDPNVLQLRPYQLPIYHCTAKTLDCAVTSSGLSCEEKENGIF